MKTRLSRPLLAAVISGALASGLAAAPALAEPPPLPGATELPPATTPPVTPPTTPDTSPPPVTTPPPPATTPPATTPPATTPPATTPPATTPPVSPPVTTPPPAADTKAPSGAFSLNRWSIWTGQSVTITIVGVADNVSAGPQITRVVTWGDGTTQTLHHTAKNVSHTYKSNGKKPITLTLTDAAGNKKVAKSVGPTVSSPALKYKLNKSSVWAGEKFVWEITSVPAGTKKISVAWGDGRSSILPIKKQKVTRYYFATPGNAPVPPGVKQLKAYLVNGYGAATPINVGKVTLKRDTSRPVLRVTPPSKANKASSWKAVKGTATDTGSGVKEIAIVAMVAKSATTVVCWSPRWKKWLNANTFTPDSCFVVVKPSKGKFSLALKNTPKGYLGIIGVAGDWAGNASATASAADPFVYERMLS
ncbi:PKD domain-containing protein [Paractinoplanes lichenicola]|uniref:PKD domain-containing protein n=1 Tax=Paractinoplanes lichenicola TaxID=2802976 RepID=A0ABS1VJD4_9ACTN|nr:PKD domain-containing protein [Actinoplanes lichenicola]MBL7254750.1 hypothetical protein [Actinoplanes lichenicola]